MTICSRRAFSCSASIVFFAALLALYLGVSLKFGYHPNPDPRSAQLAMQSLDLEWIRENFWECLIYNHYQPPLFSNILLGGLYCWARPWTTQGFLLISILASTITFALFIQTLRHVKVGPVILVLAASAFLFYPYRWTWEGAISYMSLSCSLMTAVLWAAAKFLEKPRRRRFWLLAVPVLLITLLNSFFHWMWGFATVGLLLFLSEPFKHRKWHLLAAAVLFLVVPVKNWVIFGTLSNSSCSGIVLSQRVGAYPPLVVSEIRAGRLPREAVSIILPYAAETYLSARDPLPEKFKGIRCLTENWKGYEAEGFGVFSFFNYNYHTMIPVSRRQSKYSVWFFLHHPKYYTSVTRAQVIDYFTSDNPRWDPVIDLPRRIQYKSSRGVSYRSVIYVFSILVLLGCLWRMRRNRDTVWKLSVFALFQLGFAMSMGILIAYLDGARYQFPFETIYIFVSALSLSFICRRFSRRPGVSAF